ncbi:MAG: molybdate ABC transporter substrate-binding protein [SAR202 cluster bacterium]|nr:molybdate ABC transporter substrate-binding protein [SAR202 cluster bacterium]
MIFAPGGGCQPAPLDTRHSRPSRERPSLSGQWHVKASLLWHLNAIEVFQRRNPPSPPLQRGAWGDLHFGTVQLAITLASLVRQRASLILLVFSSVFLAGCPGAAPNTGAGVTLIVSAASDLTFAFQEISGLFQEENEAKVVFNFGSTGLLAQQIEQGAPADLFAAASMSAIDELERAGLITPGSKTRFARGYLVMWSRAGTSFPMKELADLLSPEVKRIAIANPDHAPYGVAAREALQSAGLWDILQPKLVQGENVRQALAYAEAGNADVALVALSLAQQSNGGRWVRVPEDLHNPIDQSLAVIRASPHQQEARQFAEFIASPRGRAVLEKYGFAVPLPEAAR